MVFRVTDNAGAAKALEEKGIQTVSLEDMF